MRHRTAASLGSVLLGVSIGLAADASRSSSPASAAHEPTEGAPASAQVPTSAAPGPDAALVHDYCVVCHNDKRKVGGLTLAAFDPEHADRGRESAEIAEKVIRKLRLGMMPPLGMRRPEPAVLRQFVAGLEARMDAAVARRRNPGHRPLQRLNRAEYARALKDLLHLDVDVDAFFPPDTISDGFDNVADSQTMTPMMMQGYLRAASRLSSLAVGDRSASPSEATYKVPRTQSQMRRVKDAPWGTRGGIVVVHTLPADGEYRFRVLLHGTTEGELFGSAASRAEQLEISVDGTRVALLDIDYRMSETDANGLNLTAGPVHLKAGPHQFAATFIQKFDGVIDDVVAPIDHTLADTHYGNSVGLTVFPHLRDFTIAGPMRVTGVSETPSRRRIFACRPTGPSAETPCARAILKTLAGAAYRRPADEGDVDELMAFYREGRRAGDFEIGIAAALRALLVSPEFIFRPETAPAGVDAVRPYRLSDLDVASRLSFFLWQSVPDDKLLQAASRGALRTPAALEKQVRRMLADSRSESLATRFASQWLRLHDVDKISPDPQIYPSYDKTLAESYRRETEMLFESIVREDRNVLDLLTADYSFVNERIAKVYGLSDVVGDAFRRVAVRDEARRGLLGHGSVLLLTSVADRTSPVQRGRWIMEVLLGSPPPPPPPNIPELEETNAITAGGKRLSTRERLEEHRKNPACRSCHNVIDPLGLALENFDVVGAWRIRESGVAVDANGMLYDGTKLAAPPDLRKALLNLSEAVIRNFTANLMAYALGRRIEYYDQPTIRSIARTAAANGNRFSSFVLGIVGSPAFQMNTLEAETTTAEPEGAARRDNEPR